MRRGFTLIEMLVVIGILALLMGLTLGGIASMKKTDRLLVTEHLVGDVIRQARHTARTSGSPVLVAISTDAQGKGWVSGIARVPIWSESFEKSPPDGIAGNITGVVGKGYLVPGAGPQTTVGPLANRLKIVRGGKANGFYLTCQVRPPLASATSGLIPLLVIGPDATRTASLCGLMLRHVMRDVQKLETDFVPLPNMSAAPTAPPSFPLIPRLATWELVGWINDTKSADNLIEVSALAASDRPVDLLRDEPVLHDSVAPEYDIAWPMAGGRWEEVGLLFDGEGKRLVLYRNGVRVGEKMLTTVPELSDTAEKITIGSISLVANTFINADMAIIDEAAVHRLATSDPKRLPGDIAPAQTYRIVAQPDGRIEVDYTAAVAAATLTSNTAFAAPDQTLTFSGTFNQPGSANLTITIDGRVHGEINP